MLYQCDSKAPQKQIGWKGDVSGSFPFTCPAGAQVKQGKKAGEGKGGHQLDVPAAVPAVCTTNA